MGPSRFIREHQSTCWFSVPSTIAFMRNMKMLAPGAFPSVRYSIFCGQPFGKMDAAIVDSSLQFLPPGEKGELALCGEQVAKGYFT